MNGHRILIATLIFLACFSATCVPAVASSTTPRASDEQEKKLKLRSDAHGFLFAEFIKGKKTVFSEGKKNLKEVVVFMGDEVRDGDSETPLAPESQRVAGMFDWLVLRGENLDQIDQVFLLPSHEARALKMLSKSNQKRIYELPPFPLPREGLPNLSLRITSEAIVSFDEIALASKESLERDFEVFEKNAVAFPESTDSIAEMHRAFYFETLNRTFEDLSKSLNEHSQSFSGVVFPSSLTAGIDLVSMNSVLADRWVAKLYETLSQLDAKSSAELSESIFTQQFASYIAAWEAATILPARQRYAVEAHLFLCSEFCPPEVMVKQVDDWFAWYEPQVAKKGFQFKINGGPNFHLIANLYTNMIIAKKGMSIDQANIWVEETFSTVMTGKTPMLTGQTFAASDWTPKRIELLKVVPTFDSLSSFSATESKQKLVLEMLKSELLGRD